MSGSRRMACKLCRDRKVRCDGGQPSCDRCRRAEETCVYSQTNNPTKADLLQTIKTLKDRLDSIQSQQTQTTKAGYNQAPSSLGSTISVDYSDCSPFDLPTPSYLPTPSLVTLDDPLLPSNRNAYQSMGQFPDNLDTYFLNCLPSPRSTRQNDPQQFQVENMISPEGNNVLSHMPSLREIRALNRQPCLTGPPPSPALPDSKADEDKQSEDYRRINKELTTFCSVVFATQAEIAGISSAVAEYLAWIRRRPSRSAGGTALEANWAVVLETLELRVRELHDMAETRHWAAWEQMMTILKTGGLDAHLDAFERELQERTERNRQFFQESYDVAVPLREQMVCDQKRD